MSDTEEEVGLRDMEGKGKGETSLLVREMVSLTQYQVLVHATVAYFLSRMRTMRSIRFRGLQELAPSALAS